MATATSYSFTNVQWNHTIAVTFGVGTQAPTTADFFKLAIVPNQTVNTSTFEVQVIAENINPATSPSAPIVTDGSGVSHVMTLKTLKWPGTIEDSITVWSSTVPLVSGQVNNLTVVSGTKTIPFSIKHKTTLNVLTATNSTQLVSDVKAAITDPTIDVIRVAYNETNLGGVLYYAGENSGNTIPNARSYWMTVEPASGNTLTWSRDSGALGRTAVDWLRLNNIIFGSDTSDNGGGTFHVNPSHHGWVSNSQFRGKYKYTWAKNTPTTVETVPDVRTNFLEGQKVYLTDNLWDGTVQTATSYVELARDLRLNSHRGDINTFGSVVLNIYAQDIETIRNTTNTDYFHNDGFQIWGSSGTSNIVFKGLKIVSPNVPSDIQPFLLDRTNVPDYSYVLMDSVSIVGAAPDVVLRAQMAGKISNSRISNYSFPNQYLNARQDFTETNGAFSPANVYVSNMEVAKVLYTAPAGGTSITYDYNNVANTNDISSELGAIPSLTGAIFSNIKVSPMPTEGTFSSYQTASLNYRTNTGGGIFINTIGLTGLSSIDALANLTNPGLFLNLTSTANRDAYLADTRKIQLVVTVVNQGTGGGPGTQYVYTWTKPTVGTSGIWTSVSAILRAGDLEAGSSPWPSAADLWGSYSKYSLKFLP
ncbi:MAG: hypothetical protein HZB12_02985 [Candidatus Yonathbacteria bacterium]|nr:hypothetical protein [Candidatus Yonathbacteria bacterium]